MRVLKPILFLTIVLSSCQSNYHGRMVRVKKQKIEISQTTKKKDVLGNPLFNSEQGVKDFQNNVDFTPITNTISKSNTDFRSIVLKNPKKIRARYGLISKVITSQPQDSIQRSIEQESYIKEQYKKANTNAWLSLALLVTSPFTIIGILFAISQSIKAIRIYRRYENPGVPEYYGLAWGVLIFSILLVLLAIALIITIFSLWGL
ncbi:MAG: Uncharacterised protein [Bacteroidia bacterium]|nr:MAG: Uncharacterised protein [Bacteroidia bacterium]